MTMTPSARVERRAFARNAALALLGLAWLQTPHAFAQSAHSTFAEGVVTTTVDVPVADLDIRTASGRTTLAGRIAQAVSAVCAKPEPADLADVRDYKACRRDAMNAAMAEAGARVASASGVLLSSR